MLSDLALAWHAGGTNRATQPEGQAPVIGARAHELGE